MTEKERLQERIMKVYRAGLICASYCIDENTVVCSFPMSGFWYGAMKQEENKMTKQEYIIKLRQLKSAYETNRNSIHREFAERNNPYKIGDIIEDHIGKGEIMSISVYLSGYDKYPSCKYKTRSYTKAGKQSVREPFRAIYQSNIKNETRRIK